MHKLLYDKMEKLQIKLYEYNEAFVQFLVYSIYIETQEPIFFSWQCGNIKQTETTRNQKWKLWK